MVDPQGSLLLETSEPQAPEVRTTCTTAGFAARIVRCEDRDATVVIARQ